MTDVLFAGGESRLYNAPAGCDYMIAHAVGQNGKEIELYAEVPCPDEWEGMEDIPDHDQFDEKAFEELKEEITQQAKDAGIDPTELKF